MAQVLIYDRGDYELIATGSCWMITGFRNKDWNIAPETLTLQDGSKLVPGDDIKSFRSNKTSAGFPDFDPIDSSVTYLGCTEIEVNEPTKVAVFGSTKLSPEDILIAFSVCRDKFGGTYFIFSTQSSAARVVETAQVKRGRYVP